MKAKILEWLECLARIGLGGLFIYSAWSKIADPGLFAGTVMRYEMLPKCLVGLFALTLPMVELLSGLALIVTKWLRETALLIAALLVMFIVALSVAVIRGLEIDCGCFGVPSVGGRTELLLAIVRDVVLLVPAVWLMFRRNSWLGVRGLALLTLAVLVLFGATWLTPRAEGQQEKEPVADAQQVEKRRTVREKPQKRAVRKKHVSTVGVAEQGGDGEEDDDEEDTRTPEERKLQDKIEDALDKEDLAAARALAAQALTVKSVEVRQAMVDALGWFGVKTLPELTPFLADPDEDVRDSAQNEWSMAVSEIEDDAEKLGIVELAMHVLNDEDPLEDISNEYIGVDEKLAVESLLRIIEAGGSENGIAKAKETYEFVTGETFTDRTAAEKWIAEEYEPPEEGKGND